MKRPHVVCINSNSDSEDTDAEQKRQKRSSSSRAKSGAATYLTSFKESWSKEWPFVRKAITAYYFWCDICRVERSCGHQGRKDVEQHLESASHRDKVEAIRSSQRIQQYFHATPSIDSMTPLEVKVRRAEVKVATTMVKHNILLAFAEHLSPLFSEIFTDSEIAKAYGSGKTKTTCILNGALKPYYQGELLRK